MSAPPSKDSAAASVGAVVLQFPGTAATRPAAREAIRYAVPAALGELDPARHHVVEASAGTGKTYLIEHRLIDLLLTTDTLIEQILVVTFTEKATAELRFRIRRLIENVESADEHSAEPDQPHWFIDTEARRRLTDALLGFERAAIYTIHGFCQRVLTENAFSSRRLFSQTQVAGEDAFAQAFKSALREDLARDDEYKPYLASWQRSGRSVDELQQLLYRCASQSGRIVPEYLATELGHRLDGVCQSLAHWPQDDEVYKVALKQAGVRGTYHKAIIKRARILQQCLQHFVTTAQVSEFLRSIDAQNRALGKNRIFSYLGLHLSAAPVPEGSALAHVVDAVRDLDPIMVPLATAVAQRFLPAVIKRLEAEKNRRGQFDFHDMLRLVWRTLSGEHDHDDHGDDDARGAREIIARLRERYRFALIDEFQDTDELQWKIFRRLFLEDVSEANRLCIIGDPKQAIYSFRGADVFTYLLARREVEELGGGVTNLIDNYRSTDTLIHAYNFLFSGDFFSEDIRYDHPVRAARKDLLLQHSDGSPAKPFIVWQAVVNADGQTSSRNGGADRGDAGSNRRARSQLKAEDMRAALRARMANEIHKLLFDPDSQLRVGTPDNVRPVGASQIFVLTRTANESNELAEYLRAAGIPCTIYKQDGLFQTREAHEVRDLLAGVAEPDSRPARFRAWCTRFFGASLSDLPHLAELAETHPFVAQLYEWKAMADRLEYEALFAHMLDHSGVVERELFLETSERSLTNFEHLFELLLEEIMRSRCEIHELVQRLERWIADTGAGFSDERNIQRIESEREAVQIMTIHRSKGLEADVVFLYGGFGAPAGDDMQVEVYHEHGERLISVGLPQDTVADLVRRESSGEDQRLLYVAVTRAVARVYAPYAASDDYRHMKGAYLQLNRRLEQAIAEIQGGNRELDALFALEQVEATTPQSRARARAQVLERWRPPDALLADTRQGHASAEPDSYAHMRAARAGFVVTSYTSMKAHGSPASSAGIGESALGDGTAVEGITNDEELTEASSPLRQAPRSPSPASMTPLSAREFKTDRVDTGVRAAENELPGGAQTGVFLHSLLEHLSFASAADDVDFATWCERADVAALFRQAILRYDRDPAHLRYSQEVIFRCVTTPLRLGRKRMPPLAHCETMVKEMEFMYPIPHPSEIRAEQASSKTPPEISSEASSETSSGAGPEPDNAPDPLVEYDDPAMVRGLSHEGQLPGRITVERGYIKGFMDLMFEFEGRVYVLDWKSDILADYSPRAVARHVFREYRLQAQLYTIALKKMLHLSSASQHRRRFGGLIYCFMRGLHPPVQQGQQGSGQAGLYYVRPSFESLLQLETDLAESTNLFV